MLAAACVLAVLAGSEVRPPALHRSGSSPSTVPGASTLASAAAAARHERAPSAAPSLPVVVAVYLAIAMASSSFALVIFGALPRTMPGTHRRAISAGAVLAALLALERIVHDVSRASGRAVLGVLSACMQAASLCAAGWASWALTALSPAAKQYYLLELAAVVGSAALAALQRAARAPIGAHVVVPFCAFLGAQYVHVLRLVRSLSDSMLVSVVSGCCFAAGATSLAAILALAHARRGGGAEPPGVELVVQLSLLAQAGWATACLGTWTFSRAPALGFALVATSTSAVELALRLLPPSRRRSAGGAAPDASVSPVQSLTLPMEDAEKLLHQLNFWLAGLALWRALWFPEACSGAQPGSRGRCADQPSRLERHFLSLLVCLSTHAVVGAYRADVWQTALGMVAVMLVIARTLVESMLFDNPLFFAGLVGLLAGVGLLLAVLLAAH